MADTGDDVYITINYCGVEKRIGLSVQPSLELSDRQVDSAEHDLHARLRDLFHVPEDVLFYLHEAETARIMSKESFREPGYTQNFPRHWYLVRPIINNGATDVDAANGESSMVTEGTHNGLQNGPTDSSSDLLASFGMTTPPSDDTSSEGPLYGDDDDSLLPLSDLTALPEAQYQTAVLKCTHSGDFGLSLRHFSIQSDSSQRSDTPLGEYTHSRSNSRTSNDPVEVVKLSTTFIYDTASGGVAEGAGLETGLVVHMINGTSILRSNGTEIKELIEQCGDELTLLTLPKEHDDLQFLYPRYTYGPTGEYSTKDGQVNACDIKVTFHNKTNKEISKSSKVKKVIDSNNRTEKLSPRVTSEGVSPPTGMILFSDGEDASQENSQPCDHPSSRQPPSHDDILVEGSLCDIENRQQSILPRTSVSSGDSIKQLHQLEHHYQRPAGSGALEFTPGELDLISEVAPATKSTNEWYNDAGDDYFLGQDTSVNDQIVMETHASDNAFLSMTQPLAVKVRTRSNSSLEATTHVFHKGSQSNSSCLSGSLNGRAALTSSMSALDHLTRYPANYKDRARSTDLGRFKLKKKGNKSLEGLTRIASDGLQHKIGRGKSVSREETVAMLTRHKSDENTRPVTKPVEDTSWIEQSADFSTTNSLPRGMTGSDMSQGSKGQLSYEDQRGLSYDSTGSTSRLGTEPARTKRSSRGYQSQRAQLYKSRSKTGISGSIESDLGGQADRTVYRRPSGGRVRLPMSPPTSQDNEVHTSYNSASPPSNPVGGISTSYVQTPPTITEPPRQAISEPKPVLTRKYSLKETAQSPARPRISRPMSAIDPDKVKGHRDMTTTETNRQSLQVPFGSEPSRKIPIFKTRSIGAQVVREVNIEEAIEYARSQATQGEGDPSSSASQGARTRIWAQERSKSIDTTLNDSIGGKKRSKRIFDRKHGSTDIVDGSPGWNRGGLAGVSAIHRLSSEILNTLGLGNSPTHAEQTNIQCHGVLTIKHDLLDSGKRAQDRSWKSFYAVLASNKITFYKDRKDARLHCPSDEPPINVVPSVTDYATNYSKKKLVFRISTDQGSVFLLQASDAPKLKTWVKMIQDLNGGPPETNTLSKSKDSEGKLAPPSPMMGRRPASPHGKKGKKEDGGKRFLERLKKTLTRQRGDEPDFSSFVTFGQPLEVCPVSVDHKRVPLVVEYCVHTIEELGLDVEGIYRKPGQGSMINYMSGEMDKGTYDFTQEEIGDVHTVASLCKKFFKQLPDPMIPSSLHDQFLDCARLTDDEMRLSVLKDLVFELPTAHYHTLKFLMKHLKKVAAHSEQNKMTFRNVALVFGPTLMRSSALGHDMLASMNEGYTIVEALCKHVDHLFQNELCAEEERLVEESLVQDGEEEVATKGSPRASPVIRRKGEDSRVQKDVALAKASPQSVRRIKNNLREGGKIRSTDPKRHSFIPIEGSLSLQPKQSNWDTPNPRQTTTNRSVDSGVSSPGDQRSPEVVKPAAPKSRKTRHTYEVVERNPRHPVRHNYEDVEGFPAKSTENVSRTSNWINTHSELGWGIDRQSGRESTGSMWAPRNREQKEKRDRKRASQRLSTDSISPPNVDRERDLTMTYHEPSLRTAMPDHRTSIPTNYSSPGRMSNTLPNSSGGVQRRVSYLSAVSPADLERQRERFTASEKYVEPRYRSSHRYSHTPGRPRQYDSLQSSARQPGRRNSSSSGGGGEEFDRLQEVKAQLLQQQITKPVLSHRTHSHGRPSNRGDSLVRTSSAHQVESYLKQSLL